MSSYRSPTKLELARSALPYLRFVRSDLAGRVIVSRTSQGRDHVVYLPPDYGLDPATRYPVLYHLHGAGALWSWVKKDLGGGRASRPHDHADDDRVGATGRFRRSLPTAPDDPGGRCRPADNQLSPRPPLPGTIGRPAGLRLSRPGLDHINPPPYLIIRPTERRKQ